MALEAGSAVAVCALVRQGLGWPSSTRYTAGRGWHLRPLSVSVPFHVGLVLPDLRAPNPLREDMVRALQAAAVAAAKTIVVEAVKAARGQGTDPVPMPAPAPAPAGGAVGSVLNVAA
jgi:hypothetical protein